MSQFAIYNPSNGKVLVRLVCLDTEVDLNTPEGWANVNIGNAAPPGLFKINLTTLLPESGEVDDRTLAQAKADKRAEMTAARTAAAVGGFTVLGFTFASDPTSQMRILLGYTKAQAQTAGFSEPWLLANGNVQTLTAANMQTLTLGLWAHIKDQDAHLYALGQQIDAAATVAEVEAIVW